MGVSRIMEAGVEAFSGHRAEPAVCSRFKRVGTASMLWRREVVDHSNLRAFLAALVLLGPVADVSLGRGANAVEARGHASTRLREHGGRFSRRFEAATGQGYGRGHDGYEPGRTDYGVVVGYGLDTSGVRRPWGVVNGVPVYLDLLATASPYDDYEQFHMPDEEVVSAGDRCLTAVNVCTLYEPGVLSAGCSCRVAGGWSRGLVVP